MSLTITTAPTTEPLTLADAKEHLRVDAAVTDDDDVITSLISAARSKCESFLRASIMETVFSWTLDGFPSELILPQGPVIATTGLSISYVDATGASQTLATANYKVSLGDICRIRPAYGLTWPETRGEMDAVTVAFKAGFAAATSVPPAVLAAVKLVLHDLYENRGNINEQGGNAMPLGAQNLMIPFVRHS